MVSLRVDDEGTGYRADNSQFTAEQESQTKQCTSGAVLRWHRQGQPYPLGRIPSPRRNCMPMTRLDSARRVFGPSPLGQTSARHSQ